MRQSSLSLASEMLPSELGALTSSLRSAGLSGPHLEIGTAAGGTLKEMMLAYAPAERPKFVVVDPFTYFPGQREIVERNLRNSGLDPADVDFRVSTSWQAARQAIANRETFSFILIDAVHKAKEVTEDLAWAELLDPGGLVAFHDHKPKFPGVMWAAREFLRRNANYERVTSVDSLLIIRKSSHSPEEKIRRSDIRRAAFFDPLLRLRRSVHKRLSRQRMASAASAGRSLPDAGKPREVGREHLVD